MTMAKRLQAASVKILIFHSFQAGQTSTDIKFTERAHTVKSQKQTRQGSRETDTPPQNATLGKSCGQCNFPEKHTESREGSEGPCISYKTDRKPEVRWNTLRAFVCFRKF